MTTKKDFIEVEALLNAAEFGQDDQEKGMARIHFAPLEITEEQYKELLGLTRNGWTIKLRVSRE